LCRVSSACSGHRRACLVRPASIRSPPLIRVSPIVPRHTIVFVAMQRVTSMHKHSAVRAEVSVIECFANHNCVTVQITRAR
jgi:hypothetical protein